MIAKSPNSIALNPEEVNKNTTEKHNYSLLCPFRKRTCFMVSNSEGELNTYVQIEEEFLPCIKERCMRFNRVTGCGI